MALLDTLARRPALTNAVSVAVIVAAAAFVAVDLWRAPAPLAGSRLYFTTDDGRTYFPDAVTRVPPYDHDGQTAVRAYVYACADGKPFVAYLERYTPTTAAQLLADQKAGVSSAKIDFLLAEGTEVKPPLTGEWVKRSGAAGHALLGLKCPEGGTGVPELVLPDD